MFKGPIEMWITVRVNICTNATSTYQVVSSSVDKMVFCPTDQAVHVVCIVDNRSHLPLWTNSDGSEHICTRSHQLVDLKITISTLFLNQNITLHSVKVICPIMALMPFRRSLSQQLINPKVMDMGRAYCRTLEVYFPAYTSIPIYAALSQRHVCAHSMPKPSPQLHDQQSSMLQTDYHITRCML